MFRQDILLLSAAQISHLIRFDKRDKILVKSTETLIYCIPVDPPGNPLQRGQIYLILSSLHTS